MEGVDIEHSKIQLIFNPFQLVNQRKDSPVHVEEDISVKTIYIFGVLSVKLQLNLIYIFYWMLILTNSLLNYLFFLYLVNFQKIKG